ncbi:hypothetical protein EJ04DRAFT_549711 [Polyplosphaeria fusca]|uniref:DNA recombination and repair protein Rad51-like C-terminal domain-containing protein n=1 Tax=Polyplosphaeria fusca TaxID=682080 RepID=A0A9P4V7V2_9PLEO|nr:hypothetical protein EJ04DRAFT_549711 [Polyplosphaeria fusca]
MAVGLSAEAMLAESLVSAEEVQGIVDAILDGRSIRDGGKERVSLGVKSVDEALGGGLREGVVSVNCERGGDGLDFSLNVLASCLLQDATATAAVIDTAGNVDVLRIYSIIVSRLNVDVDLVQSLRSSTDCGRQDVGVEELAATVLDRVSIMRVFDFVGVMEAVGEVKEGLEGRKKNDASKEHDEVRMEVVTEPTGPTEEPRERIIADSEGEEEDEMLFDTEVAKTSSSIPVQRLSVEPNVTSPAATTATAATPAQPKQPGPPETKTSFMLIDSLSHALSSHLKKDFPRATNLLTTFLHSLSHLTRTYSLLALIQNPASVPRDPVPPHQSPSINSEPQKIHRQPPAPVSIFASNKLIPALGHVLPVYVDMGLLVSRLPRGKLDAKYAYAGDETGRGVKNKGVKMVGIVEVVAERWEGRGGAWGAFVVSEDGRMGDV